MFIFAENTNSHEKKVIVVTGTQLFGELLFTIDDI